MDCDAEGYRHGEMARCAEDEGDSLVAPGVLSINRWQVGATSDESDDGNEDTESERKSGAHRGQTIERRRVLFERRRSYEER